MVIYCVEWCWCVECKNFEGSEAYEEVKRTYGFDARFYDYVSVVVLLSLGWRKMFVM